MPISNEEFTSWLTDSDAVKCLLIEAVANVSSVETTFYLSSRAYTDDVAGRQYSSVVIGSSVQITERISIDGSGSISFGDIELANMDGSLDVWLNYIWVNRSISAYIGDVRWARSDFRVVFKGVIDDLDSRSNTVLNFRVRDKLHRLNTPVSELKLGGSTKNKDEFIPLTFGEVFNATPLQSNPATLEYRVHSSHIEGIIEVRDNGVPIEITGFPSSTGTFNLAAMPFGRITCSIQGDKESGVTYRNTISDIITRLVTGYGEVSNRFTSGDLDTAQLSAFNSLHPDPVGIYLRGRENLLSVCNQLAASVGAQLVINREGKLQLHQIAIPPAGTAVDITEADIIENTLEILERLPVQAGQKIGFNKNWTVLTGIESGIPQEHKDLYSQEWLTVVAEDATVKSNYRLDGEPVQIDTMLLREVEAEPEAQRILNLYKVPRMVLGFEGAPNLIELSLGGPVTITHPRFGLSSTKSGQVVALSINWFTTRVRVEVLV